MPRIPFIFVVSCICMLLGLAGTSFAKNDVLINGLVLDVTAPEPPVPPELAVTLPAGAQKWIVQFNGPILAQDKKQLEAAGARIGGYLPEFAFIAGIRGAAVEDVKKLPFVAGVIPYRPAYKIDRKLKNEAGGIRVDTETVRLHVMVDEAANVPIVVSQTLGKKGKIVDLSGQMLRLEIDPAEIANLAKFEEVLWIEEAVAYEAANDTTNWVIQTYDEAASTGMWSKGLRGEGQFIGIGDTGLDYDLPWFADPSPVPIGPSHRKIIQYDTSWGDSYDGDFGHGTHVAGTVGGDRTPVDGLSGANGIATKSRFYIQDLATGNSNTVNTPSDLGVLFAKAYDAGVRIHTNSWASLDNSYTNGAMTTDRFVWENRDFLAVFANGNSGPTLKTVGSPASAKNVISVGASFNGNNAENMADFSSCGPTADGRIKPTVTAPGVDIVSANSDGLFNGYSPSSILTRAMSGTSMATPAVAGAATLVRQYFMDGYYPSGAANRGSARNPSAALVKATIVNCAQNMTGDLTKGSIPSMGQGWGRINLSNTLSFAGDGKSLVVADEFEGLSTAENWSRTYYVAGTGQLKATLVWTDYPGTLGAARALVNDLDLKVTGPDGTVWLGNVFAQGVSQPGGTEDRLNVEEQVLVPFPLRGQYIVTVSAHNVPNGPQPFALVISGAAEVTSKGTVFFDRGNYTSTGNVVIRIADADLDTSPSVDTTTVVVKSFPVGEEETVVLAETSASSGVFTGSVSLVAGMTLSTSDGLLGVADGGFISATYADLNDGSGQAMAPVTAQAKIDNVRPDLTAVTVVPQEGSAKIAWMTNEPASSSLSFYRVGEGVAATVTDQRLVPEHSIHLGNLEESAEYAFFLCGTDEAGNTACTDSATPFLFATPNVPPRIVIDPLTVTSTYDDRIQIHGSVHDYSGISLLTVNGIPVAFGSTDGFYETIVELREGLNEVTVEATDKKGNKGTARVAVERLVAPDLVVTKVESHGSAVTGGYITVEDTVCNNGFGVSQEVNVGFALSEDDVVTRGDEFIGYRKVPPLAHNACSSAITSVLVPVTRIGSGTYYIGAHADYSLLQPESDENNNTLIGNQLTVTGGDLIPVSVLGQASGVPGGAITLSSLVKNTGTGAVGMFQVSFFLRSETGAFAGSLAGYTIPGLAAGAQVGQPLGFSGKIPEDITAGSYSVCIRVDSADNIREEKEDNNVLCNGKVAVAVPDLQVTDVSGPTSGRLGQAVSVNVVVKNTATAGYAHPSTVNLYLHPEQGEDILVGARAIAKLDAGSTNSGQIVFTILDTVPTGLYTLRAVADAARVVAETNETNNTKDGNVITIGPAEIPNAIPVIRTMDAPTEPVQLGLYVTFSLTFDDPGVDETHQVTVEWGDGTSSFATVRKLNGSITATHDAVDTHTYTAAGVYTLTLTVADSRGASATTKYSYVVIFDPDGGYVTGGGWINSPSGAFSDTTASGKAAYGFVSRYKQGATVPTGNTEFQFKAGNLDFRSASYDWLVVAGAKAMYKGVGTINGEGEFGFLLTATDGQYKTDGKDTLRMKIWNKVTGGIVYDNERGSDEALDPTTPIQDGNIIVHKK